MGTNCPIDNIYNRPNIPEVVDTQEYSAAARLFSMDTLINYGNFHCEQSYLRVPEIIDPQRPQIPGICLPTCASEGDVQTYSATTTTTTARNSAQQRNFVYGTSNHDFVHSVDGLGTDYNQPPISGDLQPDYISEIPASQFRPILALAHEQNLQTYSSVLDHGPYYATRDLIRLGGKYLQSEMGCDICAGLDVYGEPGTGVLKGEEYNNAYFFNN